MTIVIEERATNDPKAKRPYFRLILDADEEEPTIDEVRDLLARGAVAMPESMYHFQATGALIRLETKKKG